MYTYLCVHLRIVWACYISLPWYLSLSTVSMHVLTYIHTSMWIQQMRLLSYPAERFWHTCSHTHTYKYFSVCFWYICSHIHIHKYLVCAFGIYIVTHIHIGIHHVVCVCIFHKLFRICNTYTHACMYTYIHTRTHARAHTHTHMYMYIHVLHVYSYT